MVKPTQDIVYVIQEQVRDLARDPFRRQEAVVSRDVPGGTVYLTGLDPKAINRTLVCCVFNDAREALHGRLSNARVPLSPTQTEVALMLADRLSNREIAETLGSSPHTVRKHTAAVLQRLQVKRRNEVQPALHRWLTQALHDSIEGYA
jgi:DNA-binding CsgD family transcriptional regulator